MSAIAVRRLVIALSLAAVAACGTNDTRSESSEPGVVIGGDGGIFDPGETDAGGGSVDAADDGGTTGDGGTTTDGGNPTLDIGIGEDSGPIGDVCTPGATECEDDILLTCNDDGTAVGRTRCAARDAFCAETDDGAACVPFGELECEPGSEFCSDDGDALVICSDDGTEIEEVIPCPLGCDPDVDECIEEGGGGGFCDDITEIEPGDYTFNFCDEEDDEFYEEQEGTDCRDFGYEGSDTIAQFTLDTTANVLIDLRDDDGSAAIDTILYLRTDCEDSDSQIACSDDVPCEESDVSGGSCVDGRQPRQSRIELELDAGTYYVVADSLQYRSRRSGTEFTCGRGLLRLRID